jgi:hypothetical protein
MRFVMGSLERGRRLSRVFFLIACMLASVVSPRAFAGPDSPDAEIRAALTQWTSDFNAGRADKVCELFAPSLRADVRGAAERDFDAQCKLLRQALADPEQASSEAFELKEIVTERDMAVVRLTWTTTTRVKARPSLDQCLSGPRRVRQRQRRRLAHHPLHGL